MTTLNAQGEEQARVALQTAAACIRDGGVVAFPTETFYGLGAHALHTEGCERIFRLKGRSAEKGLPLIMGTQQQLRIVATDLSPLAAKLAGFFWPGPLTLVVEAHSAVAASLDGTVAVRVSGLPFARELAIAVGAPVTGTSANLSGAPPAETAADVEATLGARLDFIIDGGRTAGGAPSTIIDVTGPEPRLLREGAVSFERIRGVLVSGS